MKYLADTNVLSELRRPRPDPTVRETIRRIDPIDLFISVILLGEVAKGVARLADAAKRAQLVAWLNGLEADFAGRVLSIDNAIARRWGETSGLLAARGVTLPPADGLIAATCLMHDLTLLTRNVDDFHETGVRILNPWTTPVD